MTSIRQFHNRFAHRCLMAVAFGVLMISSLAAQPDDPLLNPLGQPDIGFDQDPVSVSANFTVEEGSRRGKLHVTAVVIPGWHIYSVTQKPGGPLPTTIKLGDGAAAKIVGKFQPSEAPKKKKDDIWPDVEIEEHEGKITWTAEIELSGDADVKSVKIPLAVSGLTCSVGCIPFDAEPVAEFNGTYPAIARSDVFKAPNSHVEVQGRLELSDRGEAKLLITTTPDESWHIYGYEPTDPELSVKPTLITVDAPIGWSVGEPQPSKQPKVKEPPAPTDPEVKYHDEQIVWTVPLQLPKGAKAGEYSLSGMIAYQACDPLACVEPTAAKFVARVGVGSGAQTVTLMFSGEEYDTAASAAKVAAEAAKAQAQTDRGGPTEDGTTEGAADAAPTLDRSKLQTTEEEKNLAFMMLVAFGAGLILNVMPCVLPVIGLKLMSFVQQAGDSRGRIFMLNLWYCLGLMSVFMILATLAVFLGLGWGEQFQSDGFNVVLSLVVFAFALSFIGVWEIPIPGFVGSSKMNEAATKEGPMGAFFKGVLTTVLATPCSGPLLVPAITFAVKQPPAIAYMGFFFVGLGMASPYLLIGAFPKLVSFLPKPGAWMDTFKTIMGFVLLGTLVYLFTLISAKYLIHTVSLMIGLWASLWWGGRIPITASSLSKWTNWAGAGVFATAIGIFSFTWLANVAEARFMRDANRVLEEIAQVPPSPEDGESHELDWQPYSDDALTQLTKANKTVFIDFTADW